MCLSSVMKVLSLHTRATCSRADQSSLRKVLCGEYSLWWQTSETKDSALSEAFTDTKLNTLQSKVLSTGNPVQMGKNEPKIILLWIPFDKYWQPIMGFGQEGFVKHNCPVSNCIITNDKKLSKQASAIVFHMRGVNKKTVFPSPRFSNQSYVFLMKESPVMHSNDLASLEGVFNLTMTYRHDSDIPIPYGSFTAGASNRASDEVQSLVAGKTKLVAWFVSNCRTSSKREEYVKKLQKYIPVDIYGRCGKFQCKRNSSCYDMLEQDYKFYLSFENSVCKGYVTEKMFSVLQKYVVPVVYGGANYTSHAPPHSVINVHDFDSPKHLAEYLLDLAQDEAKYREYFEWKKQYTLRNEGYNQGQGFCKLCEMISSAQQPRKVYDDLADWWDTKASCNRHLATTRPDA